MWNTRLCTLNLGGARFASLDMSLLTPLLHRQRENEHKKNDLWLSSASATALLGDNRCGVRTAMQEGLASYFVCWNVHAYLVYRYTLRAQHDPTAVLALLHAHHNTYYIDGHTQPCKARLRRPSEPFLWPLSLDLKIFIMRAIYGIIEHAFDIFRPLSSYLSYIDR